MWDQETLRRMHEQAEREREEQARQHLPGCHGYGDDHCCWVNGKVCRFLEEHTVPGRRWACGLRRELGSWEKVHVDPRYLKHVQPMWDRIGGACGTYPQGKPCAVCGMKNG